MKPQLLPILTAFTLVCSLSNPAHALPGESVQTVKNRVTNNSALSPLDRGIAELSGLPFYTSQGKLPDGGIVFSMSPDRQDQRSQQETIAFETSKSFAGFTRQNLKLIQQMFGGSIAEDFRRSSYVARVDYVHIENRFYRGKKFAYTTTEFKQSNDGRKFYHFTVLPLKDLNGEIRADQQCRQQSENGCGD
ncbi:MAG: hypothetical protein KME10_01875 [Plectolyngbya sp. WJT66-NPBG17]|jgi:hypothetical protein|nr:hypothetical protein [Plectolyngbya sp. WJT66-NPBG17]MBW4523928.1 hypothetical protein [Phormidium tanganyikae FI6-MK23]